MYEGVKVSLDPTGEIWVKSPYLFIGYAEGDGSARWRDGWLSVGEIGRLEGGFLYLSGRVGRMVTVADQNVFPEEIETMMLSLPGVKKAAVLPVRDALRGTVLVAMVQGDPTAEAAILAGLRAELGALKAPKALLWQTDWPVLASGKTDLRALEARITWPA
jgi:long-chain acyl-CoA synthetase